MRVELPQVSFIHGEVSPIAADRTDAQFYSGALLTAVNALIHAEGGVSNRAGLGYVGNCLSNTPNGSYLLPFVFNNQQTYVVEMAAGSMQFFSEGAFLQNGSSSATITNITMVSGFPPHNIITFTGANSFTVGQNVTVSGVVYSGTFPINGVWTIAAATATYFQASAPLGLGSFSYISGGSATIPVNVTNPYALADLPNLRWAQSADVLNVAVATQPLYQLTRTGPASFTFTSPTLLFGPFQDLNTDGTTYVYASGTQGTVEITASSPIFKATHVGALFTIQEQYLEGIPPWGAEQYLEPITSSASPIGKYIRSNGNIYQCVLSAASSSGTVTGTLQPVHTAGTEMDGLGQPIPNVAGTAGVGWQFVSTDAGVVLITQYIDAQHVKGVVQSHKGTAASFPPTVVGPPVTVTGPFTFSGTGSQTAFSPLTAITSTDPNQFFVTVGGVFQDPSTFNVIGTTINFSTAPAAGTNNVVVTQVNGGGSGNSLIPSIPVSTFWAFGSLSQVQGYASEVCFYNDRLVLAGTTQQPQSFFTSQVSDYLNFGVSNPQVDSDSIVETINSRQQNPINNLLPMNNLLLGTASASWRVTDSGGIGAITPSDIAVIPQEFYGMQPVPAVQTGTTIIYVQWGGRKIRDILYQFYNDKFLGKEITVYARQMFPYGTTCTRVAFAPEPYGLIYCVRSDGVMCVCTYLPEQEVVAWSRYITLGNFEDVVVVPENGSFSVYCIVGRTINGAYQRYIERFAPREYATINDAFFVDSGLTYDGRNTSTVTMTVSGGTTWMAQDVGTLTASTSVGWVGFDPSDVTNGNAIWLNDSNGNRLCRLAINSFVSSTQVGVTFSDPVPTALQGVSDVNWTFARTTFSGLSNLPGQTVSVFADGSVQAQQTVSASGGITLGSPGGVVHVGLPYAMQLQGMNFNVQGQEPVRNHQKTIPTASIVVDQSYPFYAGPDLQHLSPSVQRQFEDYTQPVTPLTGITHVQLTTVPSDDATLWVQMSDPAPLRVLGWVAVVDIGAAG